MLFLAMHKWNTVFHFSITSSSMERAMLLIVKLDGALTANALWFVGSGGGLDWKSETECFSDVHGRAIKQIAMGVSSVLFSSLPVLLLGSCNTRSFRPMDDFSDEKLRCLLRWWFLSDVLASVAAISFSLVCLLVLLSFLARLSSQDQWDWVSRTGATIGVELFFMPLLYALFWSTAASAVLSDTFRTVHREVAERSHELRDSVVSLAHQLDNALDENILTHKHEAAPERPDDQHNVLERSDDGREASMEPIELEPCSGRRTPPVIRYLPSRFTGPDVPSHPGDDDADVTWSL